MNRPVFARCYAALSTRMEGEGMGEHRDELLAPLRGEVVEIGAGNGLNFAHYPPTVTRVVAVEPEPHLRALAERAAADAPVPVVVRAGAAERLPLPDDSVDAAVLCLVLCSFADRPGALDEIARVLRPGGVLRFLEHTVADTGRLRRAQRIADATLWPVIAGGCHAATDPAATIGAAGWTVTELRRFRFLPTPLSVLTSPHVLGTASVRAGSQPE